MITKGWAGRPAEHINTAVDYVRWALDDPSIKSNRAVVLLNWARSNDAKLVKRLHKDTRKQVLALMDHEFDDRGYDYYLFCREYNLKP